MGYVIANPDEYLAITGMGIDTIKITKSAWVYPFQRCHRFSIQPHDYSMSLQAMTIEKLQFLLPVVFTVGPDVNQRGVSAAGESHPHAANGVGAEDRGDALMKYAMLLAQDTNKKKGNIEHVESIVKGIIEGETRVLVSSMTMEEIFTEREQFKQRIFKNIQSELDQFGLKIYNANVKELRDAPQSNYFESLSRKAHEGASNQARVDVAEAQLKGNVGEAQRVGQQKREIAKIDAQTAVQNTERESERAEAETTLAIRRTAFKKDIDLAKIKAQRDTEAKDEELKKAVEVLRAQHNIEKLRANDVVQATIKRESQQQAADAKAYSDNKVADANAYAIRAAAEAKFASNAKEVEADAYKIKLQAEANFIAKSKAAEADFIAKAKEAEGLEKMATAYGKLSQALGGPVGLIQYMMLEKGTYVSLAKANAQAIQGMAPKMTIWNTGNGGDGDGDGKLDAGAAIRNTYQMLPPLMSTIHEQTGLTLPEWQFGKLANTISEREVKSGQREGFNSASTSP